MQTATDRLYEQALELAPADRRDLLIRLMDSLGIDSLNDTVTDTPEEIESAWAAEIRRRVDAIKNGTADLLTVEEFEHFLGEA
jgi:hypothetical protein